jgi:hypothetical protein
MLMFSYTVKMCNADVILYSKICYADVLLYSKDVLC